MLRVEHLYKYYDGIPILTDVSFHAREGEVLCIMGGSGCGKSTLLNILIGATRPDAGRILVRSDREHRERTGEEYRDVLAMSAEEFLELRRRFGVAFQNGALFSGLTVRENLSFPMQEVAPHRYDRDHVRSWVDVNLRFVAMEQPEHAEKLPSQLSGGQIKRIAMARALALDPDIVFYDEPSAGLDPLVSRDIDRLMKTLAAISNCTTVVITHELDSAFSIADHMILLRKAGPEDDWDGAKVEADCTPEELKNDPNPFVVSFLGGFSLHHPDAAKRQRSDP